MATRDEFKIETSAYAAAFLKTYSEVLAPEGIAALASTAHEHQAWMSADGENVVMVRVHIAFSKQVHRANVDELSEIAMRRLDAMDGKGWEAG